MIIFLRNEKNETLVDAELYCDSDENYSKHWLELHSVVNTPPLCDFLLKHPDQIEVIKTVFYEFQELRGWLWERELSNANHPVLKRTDLEVRYCTTLAKWRAYCQSLVEILNTHCNENLHLVED